MHEVVKVYKGGILKLPASIRHKAGIKVGDELIITVKEGSILLTPRGLIDPIELYSSKLGEIDEDKAFRLGVKKLRRKLRFLHDERHGT
ncbi:MAG: AbrB/MazE/SpoVT family DNA-binding domain-containing protein [archaeon GB-1867-005]|nr:AbrB/MazE/SpoVT family DNA-binding domain-containing protein [Candidatus Culexmicrobium cathedralense]